MNCKTHKPQGWFVVVGILSLLIFLSAVPDRAHADPAAKLTAEDYIEIYQLYSAYSDAIDTGDGQGRIDTFTRDGTFSSYLSDHRPETMDVLLKRTNASGHKSIPMGGHAMMNIHVTPTSTGADGTCYAILSSSKPFANGQ